MNEEALTNTTTATPSDSAEEAPVTRARMIGWLAANLTSEVRGVQQRRAAIERAISVVGRIMDAIGDVDASLMAHLAVDMLVGGGWEAERPELGAAVRAHITLMERRSRMRPTFVPKRTAATGTRRGRTRSGK